MALSPVSRRRYKRWSLDQFARVADWLVERYGARILLLWGPGEREVVDEVQRLMINQALLSPETATIKELGALLERSDLLISNDNGTKHIAVARDVPTITIHGPSSPVS